MKVLLIEDDMYYASTLSKTLKTNCIHCDICYYGKEGLELVNSSNYDIVVVDLKLPDISGNDLVKELRLSTKKNIPIIVLSSFADTAMKVQLFTSGVDDYIIKPYVTDELIMRLYSIFRRSKGYTTNEILVDPGMHLDMRAKLISIDGVPLELTATEFTLLEFMIINKDNVLTKDTIIDYLYYNNFNDVPTYKIIDVLVCKIRTKIRELSPVKYLHTKWGMGYYVKSNKDSVEIEENTENNIEEILLSEVS